MKEKNFSLQQLVLPLCLLTLSMFVVCCTPAKVKEQSDNNHEYIDLGLSSGTLWATCNVGANAPEQYGDYFAWGETATQNDFYWDTYKWCNGGENALTKYCDNSFYGYDGFVDDKRELDSEDDAAYVNWGPNWRMPTLEQLKELIEQCTWEWTTLNGVYGYVVTGSNGKSLFLPAAGSECNVDVGSWGRYWTRSLRSNYSNTACCLHFNVGRVDNYEYRRCLGFSVRAVRVL